MQKESTDQLKNRIEELEEELFGLREALSFNNIVNKDLYYQQSCEEPALSVIDTDYTLIEINPKRLQSFNKTKNCVIGEKCYSILRGLDQPCTECTVEQVINNKISSRFLKTYQENGKSRLEEKYVSPILDQNGSVKQIVIQSEDITSYHHLISRVGQREEFFRKIFESAGDAFLIHDEEGRIIEFGSELPVLLHYNEDEFKNLKIFDIVDIQDSSLFKHKKKLLEEKGCITFETTLLAKNKSLVSVEVIVNLLNTLMEKVYFVVIRNVTNRNIAERKLRESEERFRTLVENATDLIMRFDRNYRHLFVNSATKSVLNIEPELFIGKTHQELGFPDDLCDFWEHEMRIVFTTAKPRLVEFSLEIEDQTHFFEWQLIPEFNTKGGTETLMAIARDTTSRKSIEQALNDALLTKDKFFSILAHDLKNPFNVLLPISQTLAQDAKRMDLEQIEEAASLLNSAVKQEFNLLKNLLEWSRSQMGNIAYNPKETDLDQLVKSNILLHEVNMNKKQISVSVQKIGNTIAFVDEYMIDTVIRNLLSNAIKFTDTGGNIEVSLNNSQNRLILSVKDNGIGISIENQKKLFRIDTNYTRIGTNDEQGTGLGLILCKEFTDKNNGLISVTSELRKGSTFTVTLPFKS